MQRVLASLGLTTVRSLVAVWAVSAVVLVAGLALVFADSALGFVLFALGALGSVLVTFGMLRVRAGERGSGRVE